MTRLRRVKGNIHERTTCLGAISNNPGGAASITAVEMDIAV